MARWRYEDMIDKFCKEYGQHPDSVFKSTTFDTIVLFLCKWVDEGEFQDTYIELERQINAIPKPTQ